MNNKQRRSGILLHPTALPGKFGIGEIGPKAYQFIDDLCEMSQSFWQILPIGPTDRSFSPYSLMSTFAGNHLLISLELLVEDGLLSTKDINCHPVFNSGKIEFQKMIEFKTPLLKKVCQNFEEHSSQDIRNLYEIFCINNDYWLNDFSRFWAFKQENGQKSWIDWGSREIKNPLLVNYAKIIQFLFHKQWDQLRKYCQNRQILIIGDMPIYVSYDSADVWANSELFELDESNKMRFQSGSPPCKYNEEGQIWENPLYNWPVHEKDNFKWWKMRFKKLIDLVDIVRLDHFIGYERFYKIPINQPSLKGEWIPAPGSKLFKSLLSKLKKIKVIAEDLGDISEDVIKLRNKFNFPSMRVLQFDLENNEINLNDIEDSFLYTGTHDNNTLIGWFESLPYDCRNGREISQEKLLDNFKCKSKNIHWELINYAMNSRNNIVVIPVQDILGLDSCSRFNTPGTISDLNWTWRLDERKLTPIIKQKMADISKSNKRNLMIMNKGKLT